MNHISIQIANQLKNILETENKQKKDDQIMDIMKRLTTIKRKVEKRLNGKHLIT